MISIKATRLTGPSGSMADALKTEVEGAYNTAKWNVARSLFGNGSGILANTTGATGNIITVDNTQNLMEGLTIDIFDSRPATGLLPTVEGRRITAVDRVAKTITVNGAPLTLTAGG